MYLQNLAQLQKNGLLGNLGMGSASGAQQMIAQGQQLAQMGGMNNQLERMKQISQQSADQAMQMEKQRQAQQGSGLGTLLNLGLGAATGGWAGLAQAAGSELANEIAGPIGGLAFGLASKNWGKDAKVTAKPSDVGTSMGKDLDAVKGKLGDLSYAGDTNAFNSAVGQVTGNQLSPDDWANAFKDKKAKWGMTSVKKLGLR